MHWVAASMCLLGTPAARLTPIHGTFRGRLYRPPVHNQLNIHLQHKTTTPFVGRVVSAPPLPFAPLQQLLSLQTWNRMLQTMYPVN